MVRASRTAALGLVIGFALLAAGCSNNKDKIVGKWKSTGAMPGGQTLPAEAGLFFEFAADSQFRAYVSAAGQNIDLTKGKYSLGFGDNVSLSDLSPPMDGKTKSREKITISGDTMTVATDKGAMTFNRVK